MSLWLTLLQPKVWTFAAPLCDEEGGTLRGQGAAQTVQLVRGSTRVGIWVFLISTSRLAYTPLGTPFCVRAFANRP